MKERPILFSAPMVRAILDGRKTQTRRVARVENTLGHESISGPRKGRYARLFLLDVAHDMREIAQACPYGQPGDRLWVRETWMPDAPRDGSWPDASFYGSKCSPLSMIPEVYRKSEHCLFRSTWDLDGPDLVGWKPSIHMPRWASRITLEVTGVRVERLQDISEAAALAEGIERDSSTGKWSSYEQHVGAALTAKGSYRALWESINGPGSWEANPWVWVIEFKRTK